MATQPNRESLAALVAAGKAFKRFGASLGTAQVPNRPPNLAERRSMFRARIAALKLRVSYHSQDYLAAAAKERQAHHMRTDLFLRNTILVLLILVILVLLGSIASAPIGGAA